MRDRQTRVVTESSAKCVHVRRLMPEAEVISVAAHSEKVLFFAKRLRRGNLKRLFKTLLLSAGDGCDVAGRHAEADRSGYGQQDGREHGNE